MALIRISGCRQSYSTFQRKGMFQIEHESCTLNSSFFSPHLFKNMTEQKINYCGTVQPKRKRMLLELLLSKKPLKCGNIQSRTSDDLMAMVWRDKCDVSVLTYTHNPPATEDIF